MADKQTQSIIDQLQSEIDSDVGNMHEDELDQISSTFDTALADALKEFNSSSFDDDGFIKKMRDLDTGDQKNKDTMRHVLNDIRSDYITVDVVNQSELLLKRDITNICTQMPEMRDVVYVVRDAIIECNVSTGEVSRSFIFENRNREDEALESQVKEIETRHDLLMAIKNFIVPRTLINGEMYIHVVPYAKLFAELEQIRDKRGYHTKNMGSVFHESIPNYISESFKEETTLFSNENLSYLMESVAPSLQTDVKNMHKIDQGESTKSETNIVKTELTGILNNINVYNGSSTMFAEMGSDGFTDFLKMEYADYLSKGSITKEESGLSHFEEAMNFNQASDGPFGNIDQDVVDDKHYRDIKGCYIKYLDPLRVVPIRMDRRVIGYYYVSTTMDLASNPANPNGIVDLSYQQYTRDKNVVERLSNMIIRSFDRKMLEKNIKLKNEIAEIIMAHKFSEGKLSFIYIPENEVVRLIINEDEEGRGHSILEPTVFPSRTYLMLTMYNLLFTLNNNTTRVHYLKSSGLNKDYAAQIQRTMRKFQSRRITIDDVFSYAGVLNKIGGMGEMVLPAGRSDFKALETDTIAAVDRPIDMEFLEQQRRQAVSGTGVPHLMMINAIDEADFAKSLEMANARFLSTVSAYKIDFNRGITKLYQLLLKYSTNMEPEVIQSFRFQFNPVKQQEMNITADMIQNFDNIVELVESIAFSKQELEDTENKEATAKRRHLRLELAKKYLPQIDIDEIEEIIKKVNLDATDDELEKKVKETQITDDNLKELDKT